MKFGCYHPRIAKYEVQLDAYAAEMRRRLENYMDGSNPSVDVRLVKFAVVLQDMGRINGEKKPYVAVTVHAPTHRKGYEFAVDAVAFIAECYRWHRQTSLPTSAQPQDDIGALELLYDVQPVICNPVQLRPIPRGAKGRFIKVPVFLH